MKERRKYERFSLTLPVRMETMNSGKKQVFEFETRDISAAGAFINTMEPFPIGTWFKLDLTTQSERIKELTGAQSLIENEGKVTRSANGGVAIHFDSECRIWSLKGS